MSSAKKTAERLVLPRSRPQPEEFSSVPKLLMKIENRRGDKLHPKYVLKDQFIYTFCVPCLTPRVSQSSDENLPFREKQIESL